MGRIVKKIQNKEYGQAMAEFALTIPVFLLLIFGVIELSRFFLVYSSVFTASREATRFASSVGPENNENYKNCEEIANRAVTSGWFGGIVEFQSDPSIDDGINIYFESSPDYVVGSCYKQVEINEFGEQIFNGYQLISCNGDLDSCDTGTTFSPQMGDRVVVDIKSTYQPILGIIPEMPVNSVNGRTIMMSIYVESTPKPYEKCINHVSFVGEDGDVPKPDNDDPKILFVEVQNLEGSDYDEDELGEYQTSFSIYQISNINWVSSSGHKLLEIRWEGGDSPYPGTPIIWKSNNVDDGDMPIISIPGGENYWEEYPRNLPAGDTKKLIFVFNEDVDQSIMQLNFSLYMQHSNIPSDFCWPVD